MMVSMIMIHDYVHDDDDDDDDDDGEDKLRNIYWTAKINGCRRKSNCHHRGEKTINLCKKETTVSESATSSVNM